MKRGYFVESSSVGMKGREQAMQEQIMEGQAGIMQYALINNNRFVVEFCPYDMGSIALRRMRLNRSRR